MNSNTQRITTKATALMTIPAIAPAPRPEEEWDEELELVFGFEVAVPVVCGVVPAPGLLVSPSAGMDWPGRSM
jgi:hypothetical protein